MGRVLIVNMPFYSLRWPNIGPSLLKAALRRRKIDCDIAYVNFDFAERVGTEHYHWIADAFAFVLGGERLFAKHYFGQRLPDDEDYYRHVLLEADKELTAADRRDYEQTADHVEPFLDGCMAAIDWSQYAVVGFAASFQQTMSSLCLARRIKQLHPQVTIVFGGAACEAEMGIELLRRFPVIDYVFLGEADLTFPPLVEGIIGARSTPLPAGVVGRSALATEAPLGGCDGLPSPDVSEFMVQDMDELPYPDYDDYFQRLRRSPLGDEIEPLLFFETSRGCWWGQRRHCKFCGLNGSTLTFRSKGPQRAIDELRFLAERYGVRRACASDNILDPAYFDTLLPMLAEAGLDLSFACEMKTNLKRQQAEILVKAGLGAAQLGIETFITPVLKMVGKGACAMDNLQALKWFSESGIKVEWNILYGFPNEKPSDYAALAELLPSLYHLAPPQAVGRVRLDRFSPYFEDPEAQGMTNARPNRAFRYTYPFPDDVLARLAYYYEYDYADGRSPLSYAAPVLEAIKTWQQLAGTVTFRYWDRPDGVLILTDTRPQASAFQYRLTGLEREVYLLCDSGRRLGEIAAFAGGSSHQPAPSEPALREMLDVWVGQRITAHLDGRYLSLALRAPGDRG